MDVALFSVALIALSAFVAAPLYRRSSGGGPEPTRSKAKEAALLGALDDLEVDRASGLVDPGSYAAEKAALEARIEAPD